MEEAKQTEFVLIFRVAQLNLEVQKLYSTKTNRRCMFPSHVIDIVLYVKQTNPLYQTENTPEGHIQLFDVHVEISRQKNRYVIRQGKKPASYRAPQTAFFLHYLNVHA